MAIELNSFMQKQLIWTSVLFRENKMSRIQFLLVQRYMIWCYWLCFSTARGAKKTNKTWLGTEFNVEMVTCNDSLIVWFKLRSESTTRWTIKNGLLSYYKFHYLKKFVLPRSWYLVFHALKPNLNRQRRWKNTHSLASHSLESLLKFWLQQFSEIWAPKNKNFFL